MDDQRTDREGGAGLRFGLKAILLLVAILAACFAVAGKYYRQSLAAKRELMEVDLAFSRLQRETFANHLPGNTAQEAAQLHADIARLDSEIAAIENELQK